eukprot:GHVU01068828.1.p6 GENE.GHVU01068828.1~~GHVU01068828.1.p6  ORF type:complete len:144 (-),score=39.99 GHVU01068828.1:1112-1543(-)
MEAIFKEFCGTKTEMDGRTFSKLCKDKGLFDKVYTPTDADLIFAKTKEMKKKTITLKELEKAIQHIADKKKSTADEIKEKILAGGGPKFAGTKTDDVRFHDDKSTYTGVHQHGGPSTTEDKVQDLSQIANRGQCDVRGIAKEK